MFDHHLRLSVVQFDRLQPVLSDKLRGVLRVDERRMTFGIVHVIRNGLMWKDATPVYLPQKTLYDRLVRWSQAGVFDRKIAELGDTSAATDTVMIDATHLKAHRTAASLANEGMLRAASVAPRVG